MVSASFPDNVAESPSGRGVLEGAFTLLEALQAVGEAGPTRLAIDTGLPKTTAYRLLQQLTAVGAVEKSNGRYRMGPRVFQLGRAWQPDPTLSRAAKGPLRQFVRGTGAAVTVCTLSRGQVAVVDWIPGQAIHVGIGHLVSSATCLFSTAAGKALLAFTPRIEEIGLHPASTHRQIMAIRESGVAFDREENMPGVCCVAVPIQDPTAPGTASIAVLCAMITHSYSLSRLAETLARTSAAITANLPDRH